MSLQVWLRTDEGPLLVFEQAGRWLHPLFAFRDEARRRPDWRGLRLEARDRVIGRGAAFLLAAAGVVRVASAVVSRRAEAVLRSAGIEVEAETWVDRIDCRTEDLLAEVTETGEALAVLEERRLAAAQRSGS